MIDMEKVNDLDRVVNSVISAKALVGDLNEEIINTCIAQCISLLGISYSGEEIEAVHNNVSYKYQVFAEPGESIVSDYEEDNWYEDRKDEIDHKFWNRYKNYLIDINNFSPNVVSTLGDDTLDKKLMNYILDPQAEYKKDILKRGLIIGDVQSGKTSTYIGFMCKAADAGYKVFILLTGTIESLRRQTQERVEEGFIGIDMSSKDQDGKRVGVGLDNKPIYAMTMTSRTRDFTGDNDKIAVSLEANNDAVVFVIKKNTTTLRKLTNWLRTLNANPMTNKIDMPMLMIDDEADNASINTSASKEDPTKINKLIRELSNLFTKSNYVGFTATPFANVFIDPISSESMEMQDLFPEDFIISLPTPSNYIGPNQIFSENGKYSSQLRYITDAGIDKEDEYPFYFKHKKDWDDDLPDSLTDAIYTYYLANVIRDLRGDYKTNRSMLINISRFIDVQKVIKDKVQDIHTNAYTSIKFNLSDNFNESMKDPILRRIYENWEREYKNLGFSWEQVAGRMFKSIEDIQIKIVNSSKGSEKLEYTRNSSLRAIAIGGLALSRGLTLEGLIVSYFYRNTCTYDVLMQMGRWFGYRKNYEDLFRIWTHKSSADWYSEIAESTELLKDDMSLMRELNQKPKDFGIRVRNNSSSLRITANNKMRNAKDEFEFNSYFGGIVETPYLHLNPQSHKHNFKLVQTSIENLVKKGKVFDKFEQVSGPDRYMVKNVDKGDMLALLKQLKISKFSSNFDVKQICDFLMDCNDESLDLFDIAFVEGSKTSDQNLVSNICGANICKIKRFKLKNTLTHLVHHILC